MAKKKPAGELAGDVAEVDGFVSIWAPMGEPPEHGYRSNQVASNLNTKQKEALHKLLAGLNANDVRLESGVHIKDRAHVVQYLLEQVAR